MPRERRERVNGPYKHGNRWRVVITRADGGQDAESFESEVEARKVADAARKQSAGRTIAHAIDAYEVAMRERNLAGVTITRARAHLDRLVGIAANGHRMLTWLTPRRCAELYDKLRGDTAVDTHRNGLAAGRSLGRFCAKKGWLPADPFAVVEPIGKRNRGKPQLGIDETRKLQDVCVVERSRESAAVLTSVLLGYNNTEVVNRQVRDLDDGGTVLHMTRGKNRHRVRSSEVPEPLRSMLLELANGRAGAAPLFGEGDLDRPSRHWIHYHAVRLCKLAKVPVVTPQGLRGTHSTIAARRAASSMHVADALAEVRLGLGHATDSPITASTYVASGTVEAATQRSFMRALQGGKK